MTRRSVLGLLPAGLFAASRRAKVRHLPAKRGEFYAFFDPVTENLVVRLTDPKTANLLPEPQNRFVSSREAFLVFTSDRTGSLAPFQIDLRSGALWQIYEPRRMEPRSLSLDHKGKSIYLLDDGILLLAELGRSGIHTIAEGVDDFHVAGARDELLVLRNKRLERLTNEGSTVVATAVETRGTVRPSGEGCAFCRQISDTEREFWYASFDGGAPRLLAKGSISCPYWPPDGRTLLFLRAVPKTNYVASELHEAPLDGSPERFVSATSQFAAFAPNGDSSVFVGASSSKAQPTVILLLRGIDREMTLCEHRATHPSAVSPAFSPNSKRVYFQSDREGKSAIYGFNTEQLVEPTPDDS